MKQNEKLGEHNKIFNFIFSDISVWVLLSVNLLTIFFAITQKWNFDMIIWTYLIQSMIIGLFSFIKIITLKKFSTEGYYVSSKKFNGKIKMEQPVPTKETKIKSAFFFLFHYGMFILSYIIMAIILIGTPKMFSMILLASLFFFLNHLFSFFYNKKIDEEKILNIGQLMGRPYLRILPMHIAIIILSLISFSLLDIRNEIFLLIFMSLKTIVDMYSHIIEHFPTSKPTLNQKIRMRKIINWIENKQKK